MKHKQLDKIVDLRDLFKCIKTVSTITNVFGISDCKETNKITLENLKTQMNLDENRAFSNGFSNGFS